MTSLFTVGQDAFCVSISEGLCRTFCNQALPMYLRGQCWKGTVPVFGEPLWRCADWPGCGMNARHLYALAFDLDGVGMPQLRDTLHQMNKDILRQATFVVKSGTGLHLYYVLEEPIPMYPHNQKCLKELKYSLTRQIWNRYTSTIKEPQMQGILQGFRVVGSGSKLGRE